MEAVLIKSLGFIVIVSLGYVLRERGFFKRSDSALLGKIVLNITLPAALLSGVTQFEFTTVTLILVSLSFIANILVAFGAKLLFKHHPPVEQASAMINSTGYNIGNITIPFVFTFFPGLGMSYVSMFDIGNALSWMGGVYTMAHNVAQDDGRGFSLKALFNTLSKSMPFLVYVLIISLSLLKRTIPGPILNIAQVIGSANAFLVMLMIGVMLEVKINPKQVNMVIKILSYRLIVFVFFALIVYFLLPLPELAKKIAIIALASPIPSSATVFSRQVGDDSSVPAMLNSLGIIIGILLASGLLILFI